MISIIKLENNRVAKYAEFSNKADAEAHATEFNGFVYDGEYQPDLWVENGKVKIQPIVESNEAIIARLESAIDRYLDQQAQSLRYESIRTMVTYENDPNPKFKAEGIAGLNLRSACYTQAIGIIDAVQTGGREVPTEEELIDELPKITDYIQY